MTLLVHVSGYDVPIICRTVSGADLTRKIILASGLFAWVTSV